MSTMQSANNPSDRSDEMMAGSTSFMSDGSGNQSVENQSAPVQPGDSSDDTGTDQSAGSPASGGSDSQAIADASNPATGDGLLDSGAGSTSDAVPAGATDLLTDGGNAGLQLANTDGLLQPILDTVNGIAPDATGLFGTESDNTGTSPVLHDLIALPDNAGLDQIAPVVGADGLVSDVLAAPASILDGNLGGTVDHIASDVTDTANGLLGSDGGGLLSGVTDASPVSDLIGNPVSGLTTGPVSDLVTSPVSDLTSPVSHLLGSTDGDLHGTPLLTVNGGNNAGDGGLLGGVVGSTDSPSSSQLINADVGPQQSNGLGVDLLSQDSGAHNTADVNAVDTQPGSPQLGELGLLTGGSDAINLPSLGDSGTGSGIGTGNLTGSVLPANLLSGGIASGDTTSAPVTAPVDAGAVHDLVSASAPVTASNGLIDVPGTTADSLVGASTGSLLSGGIASGNSTSASAPATAPVDTGAISDLVSAPAAASHGVLDVHGTHVI
jgi:hypothetical protein